LVRNFSYFQKKGNFPAVPLLPLPPFICKDDGTSYPVGDAGLEDFSRNLPINEVMLLAVKAYFDGSISPRRVALAGIVADENTWGEVEERWEEVRKTRGNPPFIHMTYLMALQEIYKGWNEDDRDYLVDGLLNVLLFFRGNRSFRRFTCSVDRETYAHLKRVKRLPTPERLCARIVFPHVMDWYAEIPGVEIGEVQICFDRNEGFMRHIEQDWRSKEIHKKHPKWRLVKSVTAAEMQSTPALQIADVIAWGCNRIDSGSHWETDPHYITAKRAFGCLQGIHRPIDGAALSRLNYREEGYAAIDPQRKRQIGDMTNTSEEFKRFDKMMRDILHAKHTGVKAKG